MRIHRALGVVLLCAAFSSGAHQDRILAINKDGSLGGLPEPYIPATLTLKPQTILRIGPRAVTLPECLVAAVALRKSQLQVTASWYHERSILPPYINIEVQHSQAEYGYFTGFSLLFNLETLALIELKRMTAKEASQHMDPIAIESMCTKEQLKVMSPYAAPGK